MSNGKAEIVLAARDEMSAVFSSISANFGLMTGGMMGGLATLTGAGGFGLMVKTAIDAADGFRDLSIKSGVAVETLSAYSHAAKLSGTTTEEVAKGLKALSRNMVENGKDFDQYGIATKDAEGKLLSVEQVFGNVADQLQRMPDGAEKSALAMRLMGKSGSDLIQLMGDGSAGLEKFRLEAEQMGTVIGGDLAEQSAKFNDHLDTMGLMAKGAANGIAGFLLPALNGLADFFSPGAAARIEAINKELANLRGQDDYTGFADVRIAKLEEERGKLDAIVKAEQRRAALAGSAALGDVRDARDRAGDVATGKPAAVARVVRPARPAADDTTRRNQVIMDIYDRAMQAAEWEAYKIDRQSFIDADEEQRLAFAAWQRDLAETRAAGEFAANRAGFEAEFLARTDEFIRESERNQSDFDARLIQEEEYLRRRNEMTTAYLAAQDDVEAQYAQKRQAFEKQSTEAKLSFTIGALSKGLQYASQTNKKAFEAQKAFSIAQAGIDGVRGAITTFNSYPYPWNIPMTIAHVAGTLGYMNQLKSASFGGGGGSISAPAGGGATITQPASDAIPPSPIQTEAQTRAAEARTPIQYNVQIVGEFVPKAVLQEVFDGFNDLIRRGERLEANVI